MEPLKKASLGIACTAGVMIVLSLLSASFFGVAEKQQFLLMMLAFVLMGMTSLGLHFTLSRNEEKKNKSK